MIQRPDFENTCQSCGGEVMDGVSECARCAAYAVLLEIHDLTEQLRDQSGE